MTQRSSGLMSGSTRRMLRHHKPSQNSVKTYIKSFEMGERAAIVPVGTFRDIPHPRYRGKVATVIGKRGAAYVVEVSAINAKRTLIVRAEHLQKLQQGAKKQ